MDKNIYFRILINAKNAIKAKKLSDSIINKLSPNCNLINSEKYWKDNSLYDVELCKKISASDPDKIPYEVLKVASELSPVWRMNIPSNFGNQNFDISGWTDESIKFGGIDWISFILQDE
jgi:hypothetical protein